MEDWKYWLDTGIRAVTAVATVVLGCLAWWIARRQAQTASDKLKFELFTRCYEVHLAIMS